MFYKVICILFLIGYPVHVTTRLQAADGVGEGEVAVNIMDLSGLTSAFLLPSKDYFENEVQIDYT